MTFVADTSTSSLKSFSLPLNAVRSARFFFFLGNW